MNFFKIHFVLIFDQQKSGPMEPVGVRCERTRRTPPPPPYGPGLTTTLKFSDEVKQEPVSRGLLG